MEAAEPSSKVTIGSPFWLDNAGVIVIKAGGTLFRASCAVLARESSVFASMFTLPQGSDQSSVQTYNGDPYLELEDTAEDVHEFLSVLHLYREYYENPHSRSFASHASILRMSTKYDVAHLRERTINALLAQYPVTLKGFDIRLQGDGNVLWNYPEEPKDFAADMLALDLARQTNVPKLLPMIMYDIAREVTSTDIIFGKVDPSNGTRATITRDEDKRLLLAAVPKLIVAQLTANLTLAKQARRDPGPGDDGQRSAICASPEICNHEKHLWNEENGLTGVKPDPDPGAGQDEDEDEEASPEDYDPPGTMYCGPLRPGPNVGRGWLEYGDWVCDACVEDAKASWEVVRKKFWQELPGIFGLPGWNELLTPEELAEDYPPL